MISITNGTNRMNDDRQTDDNEDENTTNEDRREALKKLGRYAYTAPVMAALLASDKASAASLGPPDPP